MHKFSDQSIRRTQHQALNAQKHGFLVETYGKALQRCNDQSAYECGHFIEESGKLMQQYAKISLLYAQSLHTQDAYSSNLYEQAVQARVDATKVHIQAVNRYIHQVQQVLNRMSVYRDLARSKVAEP